jgi:hypothetical protein
MVVHVTNHNYPTNNTLHMIKHDPSVLQIPFRLHSHDGVCSIPHAIYQHFENENLLSYNLTWEALLNVITVTFGLQFKDVINIATPCMMFEKVTRL